MIFTRFTYPDGLIKALTFSYDDGQIFDKKLVAIFNRYGLKGTFHLNSANLNGPGNRDERYVAADEVPEIYKGHEIACHGLHHRNPTTMPPVLMEAELKEDRKNLEALTGNLVQGLSYAYGDYTEQTKQIAKANGIKYSRTVNSTLGFRAPADFLEWNPTCHHSDGRLFDLGKRFLGLSDECELSLMYVWGHSYEFERDNNWDRIGAFAEMMSDKEDIWYATNLQICSYLLAVRSQQFSADGMIMYNPTAQTVWVRTKEGLLSTDPGKSSYIGEL